ncbi:hypothetical protein JB92DRAFT_2873303 [Gautieria morchelliformis]|nr:hypothetical protein JB92DRAFT_2873303 [Gautieria morchelliformis]
MSAKVQGAVDGSSRTVVLCFDGTGNLYDSTNTNIVKLFSFLKKDNKNTQLVYYQPGIGTYESDSPGITSGIKLWTAKLLDEAFALYLDAHVMGGYQFLMQNYRTGDRVCLFGFSRGAYTARALAGMLYKVGLLPRDNVEQVSFAYQMYKATGKKNNKLAHGFKQAFCRTVQIDFMGCWDTVSSVGVFWGRHLPFTSSNTSIRYFRQALSLDEHRAKFQPNTWHRDAPDESGASGDPEHGSHVPRLKHKGDMEKGGTANESEPPTDVLEVWFAGCHSDVGGGETPSDMPRTLSNISLRWMLREIVQSRCGIQFDSDALVRAGVPLSMLGLETNFETSLSQAAAKAAQSSPTKLNSGESTKGETMVQVAQVPLSPTDTVGGEAAKEDAVDAVQELHDELKITPIWWVIEIIPLFQSWQDEKGIWHRAFRWNLGRGRTISTSKPKLHSTVQQRMETKNLAYVPRAKWNKTSTTWVN